MQIIVEYTDNQALKLLQDLEQLNILRLLLLRQEKKEESPAVSKIKIEQKFASFN
jgi:hypothetical protein